jgi:hypothetical protein
VTGKKSSPDIPISDGSGKDVGIVDNQDQLKRGLV